MEALDALLFVERGRTSGMTKASKELLALLSLLSPLPLWLPQGLRLSQSLSSRYLPRHPRSHQHGPYLRLHPYSYPSRPDTTSWLGSSQLILPVVGYGDDLLATFTLILLSLLIASTPTNALDRRALWRANLSPISPTILLVTPVVVSMNRWRHLAG